MDAQICIVAIITWPFVYMRKVLLAKIKILLLRKYSWSTIFSSILKHTKRTWKAVWFFFVFVEWADIDRTNLRAKSLASISTVVQCERAVLHMFAVYFCGQCWLCLAHQLKIVSDQLPAACLHVRYTQPETISLMREMKERRRNGSKQGNERENEMGVFKDLARDRRTRRKYVTGKVRYNLHTMEYTKIDKADKSMKESRQTKCFQSIPKLI